MHDTPMSVPQGWQCPVCGRVYAPSFPFCTVCGNQEAVTTTNAPTNVYKPIDELVKEWKKILDKAEEEPWYINSMLENPHGVNKEDDDGSMGTNARRHSSPHRLRREEKLLEL